jgi:hypothetical protein
MSYYCSFHLIVPHLGPITSLTPPALGTGLDAQSMRAKSEFMARWVHDEFSMAVQANPSVPSYGNPLDYTSRCELYFILMMIMHMMDVIVLTPWRVTENLTIEPLTMFQRYQNDPVLIGNKHHLLICQQSKKSSC